MYYFLFGIFLFAFGLAYIFLAKKYKVIDIPETLKIHKTITPTGGGVLFAITILFYFLTSNFSFPYLFFAVILVSIISFLDDIKPQSIIIRIIFQTIAIILLFFEFNLSNYHLLTLIIPFILCLYFINSYNFMDGINGMTFLYSTSIIILLIILNYQNPIIENRFLFLILISLLVFGFFNFRNKALFFAGDIGSISIALIILFLLIKFLITLKSPILLLSIAIYIIDTSTTLLVRFFENKNIFKPHKEHFYEKLVEVKKWKHLKTSTFYFIFQIALNIFILILIKYPIKTQMIILILSYILLYIIYFYTKKRVNQQEKK